MHRCPVWKPYDAPSASLTHQLSERKKKKRGRGRGDKKNGWANFETVLRLPSGEPALVHFFPFLLGGEKKKKKGEGEKKKEIPKRVETPSMFVELLFPDYTLLSQKKKERERGEEKEELPRRNGVERITFLLAKKKKRKERGKRGEEEKEMKVEWARASGPPISLSGEKGGKKEGGERT